MPELPEVETVRRTLNDAIQGAVITRVVVGAFTGCIDGTTPATFQQAVEGCRILGVGRRGKYLLLDLDSGDTIAIHLRMTGELAVAQPSDPTTKHHHLTFALDDARELRFTDTRKFGRVRLLHPSTRVVLDQSLGPEPLDPRFTPDRFWQMLSNRKRAIKPLLLDQVFIAGIGNIYADEALFAAGIHPLRPAASLTRDEAATLLHHIRDVLSASIGRGGTTIRDYRDGLGRAGNNQRYLRIYARAAGDPCPRCGNPIARLTVAQRGTKFCGVCQPPPMPSVATRGG